jgi:LPXTG-motif cell wall-anchored protein
MKIFTLVISIIALALVVFNITKLDFNNILEGDSTIALIGIVASLSVLALLFIFKKSKAIQEKLNKK